MLALIVICSGILLPSAAAVHSQGLEWKIEVNDRYDFSLVYRIDYPIVGKHEYVGDVYCIVTQIPTIPDPVTNLTSIDLVKSDSFWANGTPVSSEILSSLFFAYPTGNWSLIQSLQGEQPSYVEQQYFETADVWGVTRDAKGPAAPFQGHAVMEFIKESGVAGYLLYEHTNTLGNTTQSYYLELTLEGYTPLGKGGINLLLVGGVVGAAVVVGVALLFIKKRH